MPSADRPPRLLVCTDTYPPQVNGVSVVTALSVRGLVARGWEVAIVAPWYSATLRNPFGATGGTAGLVRHLALPSVPMPLYPDLRLALPDVVATQSLVDSFRPDIVHCATEFTVGWLGQRAARKSGIPIVTSYHTDFSRYTQAYGVPWLRPAVRGHLARFHQRAARTFTPSEPAAHDLRALGVRDVQVWGRGVDLDLFHPRQRSAPLRAAYGMPTSFLFLHVGRLAAEKGVERIVAAYRRARGQLPADAIHLVIAGEGPRAQGLREAGTQGITFLGNLDRETILPRLYASADAFLFSSLTETLGLVILEAMASALPVIAAPAGGVADHLRDGVNGVAVAANDVDAMAHAMVTLALDRPLAAALGRGARATAERLSWDEELDRLDTSLRSLIAVARGRPPAAGAA